ncbi:MAG: permease-like cell division protein FtsX [Myxococcota bacterium]|nr:permease-like cell division protein FtsX [Myxococcota bacterium]
MTLYRISYFFREAFKNVVASPVLTVISVLTVAVSLILVGFFGGLLSAASDLIDGVAEDIRISAYLEPEISTGEVDTIIEAIKGRDGVEEVRFVTLEEDRARNRLLLSEDLLAGLDEQSIPAAPTLEIILEKKRRLRKDVEVITHWVAQLHGVDGVSEVEVGMDKIRLGLAFVDVFRTVAWSICLVLVIAAVFFVFSTIKMAVHNRSDEIEILRLVGATKWFIRMPYYIEGMFQGLSGSIIAFLVVLWVHARLDTYIREEHLLDLELDLIPPGMIVWFFVGGIALGLLGSVLSVGRYLRS